MYVQITTKCNMLCSHCLFSCGPRGEHMSRETYRRVLDLAGEFGCNVFLGGGEPTIHPNFAEFVALSLSCNDYSQPGLVTNGTSDLTTFKMLVALEKAELFYVGMSDPEDGYHDFDLVQQHWIDWAAHRATEFDIPGSGFHKPRTISALGRATT